MCDYSLQFVANRPAKVGDKLVSSQFVNSFTRGFTEVGEPGVAVCLLPGPELVRPQCRVRSPAPPDMRRMVSMG